jgi:hypothetical protein
MMSLPVLILMVLVTMGVAAPPLRLRGEQQT